MHLEAIGTHDFHIHWQSHLKLTTNLLGTACSLQSWSDDACWNECIFIKINVRSIFLIINKTSEYLQLGSNFEKQKSMQTYLCFFEKFLFVHIYVLHAAYFFEGKSPHTHLREEGVQWSLLSHLSSNRKMPTSLSPMQKYSTVSCRKYIFVCRSVINSRKQ